MTRALVLLYVLAGCAVAPPPPPAAAPAAAGPVTQAAAGTGAAPGGAALPGGDTEIALAARPSATPAPSAGPGLKPAAVPSGWPTPCPETGKGHVAGHVLVAFKDGATDADRAKFRQKFAVLAERSLLLPGVWVMRVACDADIPAVAKEMSAWPGVRYAEPDAIVTLDDPIESR